MHTFREVIFLRLEISEKRILTPFYKYPRSNSREFKFVSYLNDFERNITLVAVILELPRLNFRQFRYLSSFNEMKKHESKSQLIPKSFI